MSTIVTRAGKGSPLTHVEVDANFTNLNTDKVEKTAADITGGTINGTTIGATTPSTVNATTITGQTARVNGTGQNLLLQSQDFTTTWSAVAVSRTANTSVAPDGTTTADTITEDSSLSSHLVSQTVSLLSVVTLSVFAKLGSGSRFLTIGINKDISNISSATFNLSTGVVTQAQNTGTYSAASATITAAAQGFYRCTLTVTTDSVAQARVGFSNTSTPTTSNRGFGENYTGDGTSSLIIWGAQLELGSTANTYIPTTTTAVYGTPTLSFSGVSEIGLLSNGALYLQPAGTGALQAQATTSTTAGGNARGTNAVDWQTFRNSANQVASGSYAVVGGGANNRCSAFIGAVVGGSTNAAASNYSFIGGGSNNSASSGDYGTITGGQSNAAAGYYNFIGAGFTNAGTSASAVTTQSGTMNATTAVTLSGSNANIKVGQYITGTSIASDTYVAAISGTALTLSKNASGSSTSTLSFFTPHGVVVGGGNNQATGSYSFIGGGGDAGTAANRNVASGDWSFVGGGQRNTASGIGSVIAGGGQAGANAASGSHAMILGGALNTASSSYSTVLGGLSSTANSVASISMGRQATTRSIDGIVAMAASSAPIGSTVGANQSSVLVLAVQTTDATPTALRSNTSAAGTTNQVILPNNSAYFFTGEVISGVTGGGDAKGWTIEGVIKRGANAAATALVGIPTVTSTYADLGAATWDIAVTADTTNGGIRVTFTGQAATTIRTVCQIRTTEMTY